MTDLLTVTGLRKTFAVQGEEFTAVDDVSFSIPPAGSLAVVGQSGSGKTTGARIVAGLEPATGGTVEFAGEPRSTGRIDRAERKRRARQVQMVFQDPNSSLGPRQTATAAIARSSTSIATAARAPRTRRSWSCWSRSASTSARDAAGVRPRPLVLRIDQLPAGQTPRNGRCGEASHLSPAKPLPRGTDHRYACGVCPSPSGNVRPHRW
ncbi:ATP-binding cassette domain-containing protein [Streptomyces sp. CA-142005]|uniref:ATP-binding cassette domain-containing protein n=1 Tax=Streptomyces sp. CA-142005 TaxID=3240052 RepID=UPI003D8A2BBF